MENEFLSSQARGLAEHFRMLFLMSLAVFVAFELTSLGCVENDAGLGNRAGNEPSLEMLFDFATLTFVT